MSRKCIFNISIHSITANLKFVRTKTYTKKNHLKKPKRTISSSAILIKVDKRLSYGCPVTVLSNWRQVVIPAHNLFYSSIKWAYIKSNSQNDQDRHKRFINANINCLLTAVPQSEREFGDLEAGWFRWFRCIENGKLCSLQELVKHQQCNCDCDQWLYM